MRFESVPFFDEVVTQETRGHEFSYPMELYFCTECSSVQTQHDVNLHQYYHNYQYVASHSPFVRKYMQSLVDLCQERLGLRPNDRVIEVGAADGYLLSLFEKKGAKTLGFEAAENLCQLASNNGVNVINALFTKESLELIPAEFKNAHLLVLLHTFDHLYDPAPFLDTVRQALDPKRGVFLIEVHDLQDIYVKHETALFGHEHATYLHYGSMSRFLKRHGFRIVDFNFLPKEACRGSSMLVAATPEGSELVAAPNLSAFENAELDKLSTFLNFQTAVSLSFSRLRQHVEKGRNEGRCFAGYGGWGRGVTTLAMSGLTASHLEFVVDGNRNLHGCFTPVTNLPIVGPEHVTRDTIDEVIVFNYAYIEEIRQTLSSFIEKGGKVTSVIDLLHSIPIKKSMTERPEISFIVCTRNRASFVANCIKQLLSAKTSFQFEVIVRDNCSEDNTPEVISQISDPRLRYIRASENQGWSTFLEAGKLATGEVITWLSDEDDFVFEQLEYVLSTFKAQANCNVLIGSVIVGPRSTEVRFPEQIFESDNLSKAYLATLSFSGCAGVFVRKTTFDANCQLSFIDQYDAYARQNFYQIGFIATCCLGGGNLISTSRIVAKEVRHAPSTDNWSVVDEAQNSTRALQPHYYPRSIYDRLISSLATVWENRYMSLFTKVSVAIKLTRTFITNIEASSHPSLIALLWDNYSDNSVNAYKADVEKKKLHQYLPRKLWLLNRLIGIPFHLIPLLKIRQRKITLTKVQ